MTNILHYISYWKLQLIWLVSTLAVVRLGQSLGHIDLSSYHLIGHQILELLTSAVIFMIAFLGWTTNNVRQPGSIFILSMLFLAVGAMNLGHMLADEGMPGFSPHRATLFWQINGWLTAGVLLFFTTTKIRPIRTPLAKYSILTLAFAIICVGAYLAMQLERAWPITIVYAILAIHMINVLVLIVKEHTRHSHGYPFHARQMVTAIILLVIGDLTFVWSSHANDVMHLLGHLIRLLGFVCLLQAITSWKQFEEFNTLSGKVSDSIEEGIIVTNSHNEIVLVNQAFVKLTGYSFQEVEGKNPSLLSSGWHAPEFYAQMWEEIHTAGSWRGEIWNKRKDGSIFLEELSVTSIADNLGVVTHFVGTFSDITVRKELEAKVHHQAYHDMLTGLPNRSLLQDRLQQALLLAQRNRKLLGVMYVDLDRFRQINDQLGHMIGDKLLQVMAERLSQILRASDTIARIGGDELVILLPDLQHRDDCGRLAEKVSQEIAKPCHIDGHELSMTCSIGISVYPEDTSELSTLLKYADHALYKAKNLGGNNYRYYDRL